MTSIENTYTSLVINNKNGDDVRELTTQSYFSKIFFNEVNFVFNSNINIKDFFFFKSTIGDDNYHLLFVLAGYHDWKNIIRFKYINAYLNDNNANFVNIQDNNFKLGNRVLLTDSYLEKNNKTIRGIIINKEWNALMTSLYNYKINRECDFVYTIINLLFDLKYKQQQQQNPQQQQQNPQQQQQNPQQQQNQQQSNPSTDMLDTNKIEYLRLSGSSNLSLVCKHPDGIGFGIEGKIKVESKNTTPFHIIVAKGLKELTNNEIKENYIDYISNNKINAPFLLLMQLIIENIKKVNVQIDQVDDWGMTPLYFMCFYYANVFINDNDKRKFLLNLISIMIKNGANMFVDTFISSSKFLEWNKNNKLNKNEFKQRPYDLIVAGVQKIYKNNDLSNVDDILFEIINDTRNMNNISNNRNNKNSNKFRNLIYLENPNPFKLFDKLNKIEINDNTPDKIKLIDKFLSVIREFVKIATEAAEAAEEADVAATEAANKAATEAANKAATEAKEAATEAAKEAIKANNKLNEANRTAQNNTINIIQKLANIKGYALNARDAAMSAQTQAKIAINAAK
jgi:hypothetical protein